MEIVVAEIPPKYGMLLSRSWGAKLQGNLQMDMAYSTIPIFNQTIILYREPHMKYMVSIQDRPNNTPLYSIHSDLDSLILYNEDDINEQVVEKGELNLSEQSNQTQNEEHDSQNPNNHEQQHNGKSELETICNMSFDGSCGKAGSGAGVWIHNTNEGHS